MSDSLFHWPKIRTRRRHGLSRKVNFFGLFQGTIFKMFIQYLLCESKAMHARYFFFFSTLSYFSSLEWVEPTSPFQFCRGLTVEICIKAAVQIYFSKFSAFLKEKCPRYLPHLHQDLPREIQTKSGIHCRVYQDSFAKGTLHVYMFTICWITLFY